MKQITIIIPVHKVLEGEETALFEAAINSVPEGLPVLCVGPQDALDALATKKKFEKVVNTGDTSFAAQVNLAVEQVKTKYFSILEFDDTYTGIWLKSFEEYERSDEREISVYLPLTELWDSNEPTALGFVNEAVWASSFTTEIGYLENDCLGDYPKFKVRGVIIRTEDFISVGKLYESMKVSFWYEFLMRLINEKKYVFVIPKVGYHHYLNRKGSLASIYQETVPPEEADWWMDLAKKEYLIKKDRKLSYK